jgi:hypothetical protein
MIKNIEQEIVALGKLTPAQIAAKFHRLRITGQRGSQYKCPVAKYFSNMIQEVRVNSYYLMPSRATPAYYLPDSVQEFIKQFDTYSFPELERVCYRS